MKPLRVLLSLLWLLGASAPARSFADPIRFNIQKLPDSRYVLQAEFAVVQPVQQVWTVLSDYEGIPRFVPIMASSTIENNDKKELRVRQKTVINLFSLIPLHVEVVLSIRERKLQIIEFMEVEKKEFEEFAGSWQMKKDPHATTVRYTLTVKPKSSVFNFMFESVLADLTMQMLKSVKEEIERKAL